MINSATTDPFEDLIRDVVECLEQGHQLWNAQASPDGQANVFASFCGNVCQTIVDKLPTQGEKIQLLQSQITAYGLEEQKAPEVE